MGGGYEIRRPKGSLPEGVLRSESLANGIEIREIHE